MKYFGQFILFFCFALIGAGCPLTQNLDTPRIAEPIETTLSEQTIAQKLGFGEIPKVPTSELRPGTKGSVRVNADLPTIPEFVTVLRVKSGRPNPSQLRNIGASLNIPGGVIGASPLSQELTLQWTDDQGVEWNFNGSSRKLEFSDPAAKPESNTVTELPDYQRVLENALAFLSTHGINATRLGKPYIEPDWKAWWESEREQKRCVGFTDRALIRTMSASTALLHAAPPNLPPANETNCLTPEFPSRIVVQFNATQDEQSVFMGDGVTVKGATLYVDVSNQKISSGSIVQQIDPDRSDYPGLTLDEARQKLAQGGQGGTPNGNVTIDDVSFEWFLMEDKTAPFVTYLYPAFVGSGTIVYADGRTSPYRIVVPLVSN
ncbi:MAG: hypothetical protein ABH820_02440 [Patescibacteria group bacterium]